ncbi:MAG: hypothetical protein Q9208_005351 [Pyrenodesmia sp. 3 TL-2023]
MIFTTQSLALLAALAASVTSTPTHHKRQEPSGPVVFRSDLKQGEGQSPMFKNLLLTTVATTNNSTATPSGHEISFVNMAERALAASGTIVSKGIPLSVPNNDDGSTTLYLNIGTNDADPGAVQPVTLGTEQGQSNGFLYTQGGELKLSSTVPQWDSWAICPGEDHPELVWVGVVRGVATFPADCSAVRLFAEGEGEVGKGMGSC